MVVPVWAVWAVWEVQDQRNNKKFDEEPHATTVDYTVSLEDLYNGKQAHFQLSRNVFCPTCSGSGARPGYKPQECIECKGTGSQAKLVSVGPGMVTQRFVECTACHGEGVRVREKERCKRCKGSKVVSKNVKLDVEIRAGMRDGQRLVFREQSDCVPGYEKAGHLIMVLRLSQPHSSGIEMKNNDLCVQCGISLSEALLGFRRAVFTHLDGRSIRVKSRPGSVIRPGDVCVLRGEGMPSDGGARKGDL